MAGWTGAAEGAWCSPTLSCLAYIPFAVFGGILFAIPATIVAAPLVLITVLALRIKLSPLVVAPLVATMGFAGFLFGSALASMAKDCDDNPDCAFLEFDTYVSDFSDL
jgi:hypothetical protein